MRIYAPVIFLTVIFLFSCNKEEHVITPPQVSPVLLKDIIEAHLPSPYYHFEYNLEGKISFVSFASDLNRYNVTYNGDKISAMQNNILVNKDRLIYQYNDQGMVSKIFYLDSVGNVYTRVYFTYDGQKLINVMRERKSGENFLTDKILTLAYYADGNLQKLDYHYPAINGQLQSNYTDWFSQYDDKINVESFSLLHNDFFDHLILLPEVHIQKNNPRKEIRTGDGVNYVVNYSYTYNGKNAPLIKTGELTISTGPDAGKKFQILATFSYY